MSKLHYFNITYICDSDCLFCAANIGIINHKDYTMTVENFEQELLESGVQNGDRVMISGGEPTLSPFFWEILDVCEKYNCCIDLTTNGHYFAENKNVERISKYKNLVIRIPFFGLEKHHDYLTGKSGNFYKSMSALDNLSHMVQSLHLVVNVKFLLCKATVSSNIEIYDYIYSKYKNIFEYTLSPLLVSRKTIQYKEELLAPYSELINKSIDFIEKDNLNCDIIPLCLLSKKKIRDFLRRKKIDFSKSYNDAQVRYESMNNYECVGCDTCRLNNYCDKFLPSYIEYFGTSEIAPF